MTTTKTFAMDILKTTLQFTIRRHERDREHEQYKERALIELREEMFKKLISFFLDRINGEKNVASAPKAASSMTS